MRPYADAARAQSGDEFDVTTGWRRVSAHCQRPGVCAKTKRRIRRRARRALKSIDVNAELDTYIPLGPDVDADWLELSLEDEVLERIDCAFWGTDHEPLTVPLAALAGSGY